MVTDPFYVRSTTLSPLTLATIGSMTLSPLTQGTIPSTSASQVIINIKYERDDSKTDVFSGSDFLKDWQFFQDPNYTNCKP